MTSSKRSQIIFVSEIALVLEIAFVLALVLGLPWFSTLVGTIKRSKLRCLELGPFLIASSLAC
jgi:hypothetical protein